MSQRVLQPAFRACKCMQVRATLEQRSLRQSASNRMYLAAGDPVSSLIAEMISVVGFARSTCIQRDTSCLLSA